MKTVRVKRHKRKLKSESKITHISFQSFADLLWQMYEADEFDADYFVFDKQGIADVFNDKYKVLEMVIDEKTGRLIMKKHPLYASATQHNEYIYLDSPENVMYSPDWKTFGPEINGAEINGDDIIDIISGMLYKEFKNNKSFMKLAGEWSKLNYKKMSEGLTDKEAKKRDKLVRILARKVRGKEEKIFNFLEDWYADSLKRIIRDNFSSNQLIIKKKHGKR